MEVAQLAFLNKNNFIMKIDKKIILSSAPRSGSTFLIQIFKKLFRAVDQGHGYSSGVNVVVFRDFRDAALSTYRVDNNKKGCKPLNENFTISNPKILSEIFKRYVRYVEMIEKFIDNNPKVLYFVYEFDIKSKTGNKYETIFSKIEDYFNIIIPEQKRQLVKEYTNFDENLIRSSKFNHWGEYDKDTLIHGTHLHKGGLNLWKKHIDSSLYNDSNFINWENRYKKCIKKIGY